MAALTVSTRTPTNFIIFSAHQASALPSVRRMCDSNKKPETVIRDREKVTDLAKTRFTRGSDVPIVPPDEKERVAELLSANECDTVLGVKIKDADPDSEGISMSTMQFSRRGIAGEISISQKAYLEVYGLRPGANGFELGEEEVKIGRTQECKLTLPLGGISRVHARIYFRNEEYYIQDLGSTNGTYVNGIKVVRCVLRNNDRIDIGEAKIVFIEERVRGV